MTDISATATSPKGKKARRLSASATPYVLKGSDLHLASRFSFGVNEALVTDIRRAGGSRAWFQKQLKASKVSDKPGKRVATWFPLLKDSPQTAWNKVRTERRSAWDYGLEFTAYSIARRIETNRQVQEVMTDFWSNLLYIPMGEDRSFPYRFAYDQTIRENSLRSFRKLLRAAVVHPAMSGWLNNSDNTKRGPNENLGRELLELFTVGRAAYTEDHVKSSARILTGYHVDTFGTWKASYRPEDHWVGRVKVLGFTHANSKADGRDVVEEYLDYLARHPATAQRIARRLCVKFVSDDPSPAIVKAVARSYRKNDTDIKATLRTMVKHKHFGRSKRRKVRTPLEDVINCARVLGMRPTHGSAKDAFVRHAVWMSDNIGQSPFRWPTPDGFPETSAAWTSSVRMLRSWNIHYSLVGNWWKSAQLSRPSRKSAQPKTWPRTVGQLVEHQSRMLLGRPSNKAMRRAAAQTLNVPVSHAYEKSSDVSEWSWVCIQGAVLNAPEGVLR